MFILQHIIIATFCMYINQITSNKYNESYSLSMVCSWMYLLWLSSAFVLEHMHSSLASITTTMWVETFVLCENHTWKLHHNLNVTKIRPKKNRNNVVFAHSSITFWITNKSSHFMPYFLLPLFAYMLNKLHPTKTLVNPINFQRFKNLFTNIHASWMTFIHYYLA